MSGGWLWLRGGRCGLIRDGELAAHAVLVVFLPRLDDLAVDDPEDHDFAHMYRAADLRCYLAWRAERGLDPFLARRPHLELYIRWMQEVRQFTPSTVSRRFSVTVAFRAGRRRTDRWLV
jgi:hypothetical protein